MVLVEAMLPWSDWTAAWSEVTSCLSPVTADWSCATWASSVEHTDAVPPVPEVPLAELPLAAAAEPPSAQSAASFCWPAESLAWSETS